ncbi:MAG TPA: Spy/CpxP family protein refolding chaperone, partial [Pyrinomonadaceae bacterium]|nr:Spy/CpxP family protein refolding chaperone [Pyrinomonadaceae bacterium]
LGELDLTPEQVRQIRAMNQARRAELNQALARLFSANQALDEALYADVLNEEEIALRLREFQQAQAEVSRLRFKNELEIRKILTPEQLVKFRELRRRFAQPNRPNRPANNNIPQPIKRLRQLPKTNRPQ